MYDVLRTVRNTANLAFQDSFLPSGFCAEAVSAVEMFAIFSDTYNKCFQVLKVFMLSIPSFS